MPDHCVYRYLRDSKLLFYLLLLFTCSACLDKIDLEIPERQQENLIIQGRLLKGDPSRIEVLIRKLFNFEGIDRAVPVFGTKVTLLDDAGHSFELKVVKDLGAYLLDIPPEFPVEAGKKYLLRVELNDGRVYESDLEPMLRVPKAGGLTAAVVQRLQEDALGELVPQDFVQFRINSSLNEPGTARRLRLKWDFEHTYLIFDSNTDLPEPRACYISESLNVDKVVVFDGEASTIDALNNEPLIEIRVDWRFANGYYLTVFQQSLTPGAFEYWNRVRQLVDRTGNMFEAPPGKLTSNIHNVNDAEEEVYGYFYATDIDTVRLYIPPGMVGSPNNRCPTRAISAPGGGCPVRMCCNCLDEERSTLERPAFWVE